MNKRDFKKLLEQVAIHLSIIIPWEVKEIGEILCLTNKLRHNVKRQFEPLFYCTIMAEKIVIYLHLQEELVPFEMSGDEKASQYVPVLSHLEVDIGTDAFEIATRFRVSVLPGAEIFFNSAVERFLKAQNFDEDLQKAINRLKESTGKSIEISATGNIIKIGKSDEDWYIRNGSVSVDAVDLQIHNMSIERAALVLKALNEIICTECDQEGCLGVRLCPQCGASCHNDVSIQDRGKCLDCHRKWQWGETETRNE